MFTLSFFKGLINKVMCGNLVGIMMTYMNQLEEDKKVYLHLDCLHPTTIYKRVT